MALTFINDVLSLSFRTECCHQMRPLVAQLVALAQIVPDEIDSLVVVLIVQVHNRPSLDCDHLNICKFITLDFSGVTILAVVILPFTGFLNDLQHKLVNLCVSIAPLFPLNDDITRYGAIRSLHGVHLCFLSVQLSLVATLIFATASPFGIVRISGSLPKITHDD